MSATIATARVTLRFVGTRSLKEKRAEVKRVVTRLGNRFNAAIAEIGALDDMRIAEIGVCVVSTSSRHAEQMLATIIDSVEPLLQESFVDGIETDHFPF